jgi:integrase
LDATEPKTVAGDKKKPLKIDLLPETMRGYIVQFTAYLERNGFDEDITYPAVLTRLVAAGADLLDAESVKSVIAKRKKANGEPWSGSMKMIAACAYDAFCRMQKITWDRPTYQQSEIEIIAPDEKDLDALICAASKRFATYLLCLKETFADPSEILAVEWIEFKDNVMYINHPVKRHYSGKYELSPRLVGMINALPRENKRIFPTTYRIAASCMRFLRRKASAKFNNPALLQISLKSFRHWGGSMLAYVTNGNVPEMAKFLRHKSWKSTQRYVHSLKLSDEDFDVTSATTLEDILALGKAGWQKYDEIVLNGVTYHCYRKPKRFGALRKNDVDTPKTEGIRHYPHKV